MTSEKADALDVSGGLPPGCLYARGRFAFDLQSMPSEGRLRIAARQWGRVWLNGVPLGAADTMSLSGVLDKAQAPNAVAQAPIRITRASWPSNRSGLIYLFEGSRADNTIYDPVSGPVSAVLQARFDRNGAILCRGAKIELPSDGTRERLLRHFSYYQGQWHQKTELFTLEMVVQTADMEQQGPVLSLDTGSGLWVGQEKQKVVVRLGESDPKEPFDAGTLPDDKAHHLVIAYRPKRLVCYVDGRKTLDVDPSPAQMKWRDALSLNIGCGKMFWRGRLEGIAMYSRFVEEAAVDAEIERLRPLIEMGGYIPCPDHRIAPDAKFENVCHYAQQLRKLYG